MSSRRGNSQEYRDLIKTLFRRTVESELEWQMDGMSRSRDSAVKTMIADRIVTIDSNGKMVITTSDGYKFSWKSEFTRDLYKAARNNAWDGPNPEDVIESFLEDIK